MDKIITTKMNSSMRDSFVGKGWRIRDEKVLDILSNVEIERDSQKDIPKILHFIWLGSRISKIHLFYLVMLASHNRHWEINLWVDDNNIGRDIKRITVRHISEINLINEKIFDKEKMFAAKADILRYEVVYQYGGMYLDIDCEYYRPFDHNFEKPFVVYYESGEVGLTNSMFGFEAGSKFLKYVMTCMSKSYHHFLDSSDGDERNLLRRTGPHFFLTCFLNYNSENINMMPSWVINESCKSNNKPYVHHWVDQSWNL